MKILLVEDEVSLASFIKKGLEIACFCPEGNPAHSGVGSTFTTSLYRQLK